MRYGYGYFEEDQLGHIADAGLWKRILTHIRPHWKAIVLAIMLSLVISAASLTLPYLIREGIDRFILRRDLTASVRLNGLNRLSLLFLFVLAAGFAANFVQVTLLERTGQQIMHRLRQDLFQHLLELDLPFYHRNPVGKIVTRLTNDIQNMHDMFTSVVVTLFNDIVRLVGILAILFWMNTHLTALLCLLVPLMVVGTIAFSRLARFAFRAIRTHLARINSYLQEILSGMDIIQVFSREEDTYRQFRSLNHAYFLKTLYQIRIFGVFMPLIEVLSALSVAVIIGVGGWEALHGAMTVGILVAFLFYMRLFFQPLRELSQKYSVVQSAMASAERIFQLLDTPLELPRKENALVPDRFRGRIVFERVSFCYQPGQWVLRDLDLTIEADETIAIVGATGSGKTTLINLLERFYDPAHGRITIDGIDLRDMDPVALRSRIGLVMQDIFIVPGTFRENILLDRSLSEQRLQQVVELAQLARLLEKWPQGLDTRIGEGGRDLSSGEKQLLAIARVLARDPNILILDEATSSVDSETEILIERAIDMLLARRTGIVIAHRLSTIKRVDRILVMDSGRIVEQGTHRELMDQQGLYFQLQSLNLADCPDLDPA